MDLLETSGGYGRIRFFAFGNQHTRVRKNKRKRKENYESLLSSRYLTRLENLINFECLGNLKILEDLEYLENLRSLHRVQRL